MTTNPLPGRHFFCVDVETSALRTWDPWACLFSIGAVVVDEGGNIVDDFYVRIRNRQLHPSWYNEDLPAISETQSWWREQGEFAKDEAYKDVTLDRFDLGPAAQQFRNFVLQFGDEWTDRLFVASPDKFDWVWTDYLLSKAQLPDPFWYHGVDIWSMNHGAFSERRRGQNTGNIDIDKRFETHDAEVPHHPLSDAFALAQDLVEFLPNEVIDLDAPHIENWDAYQADLAAAEAMQELQTSMTEEYDADERYEDVREGSDPFQEED